MEIDMADRVRLWVLSDGRAGHLAQALGLAEAIARRRPADIETHAIHMKPWATRLPAGVIHGMGRLMNDWPFAALQDNGADMRWPWPDVVISAGRRTAPVAAVLRRRHGVVALQLLDPKIPANTFDAVLIPSHDDLQGANVYTSLGALNRVHPARVRSAAMDLTDAVAPLPAPRVGLLIGGPSSSAEFTEADGARLCLAIENLCTQHSVLVTTSRRTLPGLSRHLADTLGDRAAVWSPDGTHNPYPGLLGHVDAVIVTEDSVNMASEAASVGLPVHVFPITRVAGKIAQFHEDLAKYGASRRFTGSVGRWNYAPLAEADRLAEDLLRRGVI